MERFLIFTTIIFGAVFQLFGQENERYISSELGNLEKLIDKGDFVNGFIFMDNDTLETKLLTFRGKKKMNYYLFCIAKISNDSIYVFNPTEINGYKIDNIDFISHSSDGEFIFIKLIKNGKVDLYEKRSIPSDNRFLYYLRFPGKADYFIINPLENNVTEHKLPDSRQSESSGATTTYFQTKGVDEKFKIFIKAYMSDCIQVTNMVNSEFYTINDIPSIVETYNKCFE